MASGSVVEDERAVPRERAPLPADAAPARGAAVAARQPRAVHGRQRRRLVAAGRGRGRDRPRGLLPGAAHLQARPDSRQPHAAAGVQKRHPRLHEGREFPVSKLGVFLGFQTSKGTGGREGLEAKAWFRTVKWQALAARYVAKEMKFSSIWSWGWAEWTTTPGEHDPAKPKAACVYLWARSPSLCNGPRAAGKGFVRSRTEGQLILSPGLRCQLGHAAVRWSQINPILKLTGDPSSRSPTLSRASLRSAPHRSVTATSSPLSVPSSAPASAVLVARTWPRSPTPEPTSRWRAPSSATS